MYEDEEYGFCPECGGLMKNGTCFNCGYDRNKKEESSDKAVQAAESACENDAVQGEALCENDAGTASEPFHETVSGLSPVSPCEKASGPAPEPLFGNADGAPPPPPGGPGAGGQMPPYGNVGNKGPGMGPYGAQNIPPYGNAAGPNGQAGPGAPGAVPNGQNNSGYASSQQYAQQNGYYGQIPPGGVPPYGQPYGAAPNMPSQKPNSSRTAAAIIIGVIAVLLCIVMILIFVIVKGAVREAGSAVRNPGSYGAVVPEETLPHDFGSGGDGQLPDTDGGGGYEAETQEQEEDNYVPSPEDDYYVTLADSVRDDLSYTVEWENYNYLDEETGATAVGKYPQLKGGNIPHLDKINEEIEYEATYYSKLYGYYKGAQGEDESIFYATSSIGYVTYMDEEKISVVLQEKYAMNQESYISLYCINIDLVSGELLDNGEMIEYNEQLTREFRAQDAYQNGTAEAVERMSDEQLQDFLSDSDTNIIFYTPVGLEIGFNYTTSSSSGWVTATIKDYGRYMKKI